MFTGNRIEYGGYVYWVDLAAKKIGCERRWPMTDCRFIGDDELTDTLIEMAKAESCPK